MQTDPIGLNGGLNLYNYAAGNSLTNFDSSGLETQIIRIIDHGLGFDHIALRINNSNGDWVYGFIPTTYGPGGLFSIGDYAKDGYLAFEYQYRTFNADVITLDLTDEQEQALSSYIEGFRTDQAQATSWNKAFYSILGGNVCSSEAAHSLSSIGLPLIHGYRPVNFINDFNNLMTTGTIIGGGSDCGCKKNK